MEYAKKYKHGFVLGKFLSPTTGHQFLCEFARASCDNLTILVCSLPDEPIPGKLRYEWMKQMFPNCRVLWCDKPLPQEPKSENDLEFWSTWKKIIDEYTIERSSFFKIDAVFASENYGERLAKEIGAQFVPCDINREFKQCSGTAVRNNPFKMWSFIPEVVKPYYVKRICMFGPESSGKTTLAKQLAAYYNTVYVPEYGRTYTEFFGPDVNSDDLVKIVQGHMAYTQAAKCHANRLLIEDTDPVMSAVWSDMLIGKRDPWLDKFNDYADLYIVCDIDIPWVDDGTRYFPKPEDRKRFWRACVTELGKRNANFICVSGTQHQRLRQACAQIEQRFLK